MHMWMWGNLDLKSALVISSWASFGPKAAHSSHSQHWSAQPVVPDCDQARKKFGLCSKCQLNNVRNFRLWGYRGKIHNI